jgi:hypothetical protein
MANFVRSTFLHELTQRYGTPKKLPNNDSLFDVDNGKARLYVRYSKKHARNSTFYGLRKVDLNALEGRCGILCYREKVIDLLMRVTTVSVKTVAIVNAMRAVVR